MNQDPDESCVWEILVPTVHQDGRPISTRYHRVWDSKVREISGGLTILKPAKGQWISPDGKLFAERMIPVRIVCSRNKITDIALMSVKYYKQKAVMVFKISDTCMVFWDSGKK